MRTLWQDLRFGFRILTANPALTTVAVLTLAVGIASGTVVFSWIDAMLYRPTPGASESHDLVSFQCYQPDGSTCGISYAEGRYYQDHLKLSTITLDLQTALNVGDATNPDQVWGQLVFGNYFEVIGVKPRLGRFFSGEERGDSPGASPVVVIGHRYWKQRLRGDPNVIGKSLVVNRRTLTIIGVAPEGFVGYKRGLAFELWIPATMGPSLTSTSDATIRNYSVRDMHAALALKPGVSIEQASAEVLAVSRQLANEHPDTNRLVTARLFRFTESGPDARSLLARPLTILMGVCLLVLLIACANVANLLLARATARQKEFNIRLALGAARARLVRQLFTETLLLAAMAALFGVLLAQWMMPLLRYVAPPTNIPVEMDIPLNSTVMAFAILITVAAALVCGTAPALHAIRSDLNENLKDQGGRGSTSGAHTHRLRSLLVISEMALALMALVGAGLFLRSFYAAGSINPGFDTGNVLVSQFYLWTAGYSPEQQKQFCARLRERMESLPGVAGTGYATFTPLGFGGSPRYGIAVEGYVPRSGEDMGVDRSQVTSGYFALMKLPILEGREFTAQDDENAAPVMVVNQSFVRRFYGGGNAIGRRVQAAGRWFTIIGVARDAKYHRFVEPALPFLYVPFVQTYGNERGIDFYVRTTGDPAQAIALLRHEVSAIDRGARIFGAIPLADYVQGHLYGQKFAASLLGVLGGLALLLAAVGLYSVMAYSVSQRVQEIGIRLALGANTRDVVVMMVGKGMVLTGGGVLAGSAAALGVTHFIRATLSNISATEPAVYLGAAVFLAAVAFLASLVPAWRATKISPIAALRYQ